MSGATATSGTFTAGNQRGNGSITVTASDGGGGSASATANLYVYNPNPPLMISGPRTAASLPHVSGEVGLRLAT